MQLSFKNNNTNIYIFTNNIEDKQEIIINSNKKQTLISKNMIKLIGRFN